MTRTLSKGIFKRGDVYAVRFSVPTEVQSVVGKKEIIRSLGTKDLGEALGKWAEGLEQIRASLFSDVEEPVAPKASTTHPRGMRMAKEARTLAVGHSNKEDIGMSVYAKGGDLSEVIKTTLEAMYGELVGGL